MKKGRSLRLIVSSLKDSFEITLLVQSHREKALSAGGEHFFTLSSLTELGVSVIYDNSTPEYQTDIACCASRFQSSYFRWANRKIARDKEAFGSEYDCLVAWDGCSPWCLATALQLVKGKLRFLWLHDDLNLYLMRADRSFYAKMCDAFDAVLASDVGVKRGLDNIFSLAQAETEKERCTVLPLPVDVSWYWEQSRQPCVCEFQAKNINLLAFHGMNRESALERLPGWLAAHQAPELPLHCYLIGDGERLDRYIQQIAIYSADSMVTLVGQTENPYPCIRRCDALLVCAEERQPELETAAQVFGVPVMIFEELEQHLSKLSKREESREPVLSVWQEKDRLIKILKAGEI